MWFVFVAVPKSTFWEESPINGCFHHSDSVNIRILDKSGISFLINNRLPLLRHGRDDMYRGLGSAAGTVPVLQLRRVRLRASDFVPNLGANDMRLA